MENKKDSKVMSVLKVLAMAYVLTAIILLVLAFLLYKFKLAGSTVNTAVVIVYILVNVCAGLMLARRMHSRKFLWGLLIGFVYFVVLSIVSFIVTQSFYADGKAALTAFAACVISGMTGGMISK